jgi:hypothetical protein
LVELRKKSGDLEFRYYIQKAKLDFQAGMKLDAVITELKIAADSLKSSENTVLKAKLDALIGNLEKMPVNVFEDFNDLEKML